MKSVESIADHIKSALGHFNQGKYAEAEIDALRITTQFPSFGHGWKILGVAQYAQEKEALSVLMRAAALLPTDAEVGAYLGAEYLRLGDMGTAEQYLAKALNIDPQSSVSLYHMGRLMSQQGRWQEAAALLERASLVKDPVPGALFELGNAQFNLGRLDEAEFTLRKSVVHHPEQLEAQIGLGMTLLLKGQLNEGFQFYESRWKLKDAPAGPKFFFPQWDGRENLAKKSLLFLCAEQGFGDSIQFVRFAKVLEQQGAIVSIAVNRELGRLFSSLGINGNLYVDGAVLPSFDYWCYAMSVPHALGISLNTIPYSQGYLPMPHVEPVRDGKLRVGVAWQGNPRHKNDKRRSIHLKSLSPLFETEDVEFVSLQKELSEPDLKLAIELGLKFPQRPLHDFQDTAELISALDIVISVDSSVAHLSGALGRETWVLLPAVPDWRWLMDRNDSPWYDSMRLYRQPIGEDWSSVVNIVKAQLRQRSKAEFKSP